MPKVMSGMGSGGVARGEPPVPAQPGCCAAVDAGAGAALRCHRAAGPAHGGTPLPWGCHFAPCFSPPTPPPSACHCLPLRCPAHTGGCVLDGDMDPCQSQLAEINTPGLKGLRAPGGWGASCDSRAPCPAIPALRGTPCAGAAHGHCLLPCPPCRAAQTASAPVPLPQWNWGTWGRTATANVLPGSWGAALGICTQSSILPADARGLRPAGGP